MHGAGEIMPLVARHWEQMVKLPSFPCPWHVSKGLLYFPLSPQERKVALVQHRPKQVRVDPKNGQEEEGPEKGAAQEWLDWCQDQETSVGVSSFLVKFLFYTGNSESTE